MQALSQRIYPNLIFVKLHTTGLEKKSIMICSAADQFFRKKFMQKPNLRIIEKKTHLISTKYALYFLKFYVTPQQKHQKKNRFFMVSMSSK